MSIIPEHTEYDGSDGEGDPNYYHRYRDILDEEENENDSDAERSDEDVTCRVLFLYDLWNDFSPDNGMPPNFPDISFKVLGIITSSSLLSASESFSFCEITENSDPSSLGFLYHGENSQRSTGSFKLDSTRSTNGNGNGHNHQDPKEMKPTL
jgi:hypothetical protein